MRRRIRDPESGWRVFWRTFWVLLAAIGLVVLGFFVAWKTAEWIGW